MTFLQIDLPAITVAILAGLTAALVGNLLILRRQALMGDALSHMVLPGIVAGYLISGHPKTWVTIAGALVAGLVGAAIVALIRKIGRLDMATAMGVVLTAMFAVGVLLIETTGVAGVHLDVEHVLYGSIESVIWPHPVAWANILSLDGWDHLPEEIPFLAATFAILSAAFLLTAKEITLVTFDPGFGITLGLPFWVSELAINGAVTIAVVAAFDAAGSILVIAMLICPAATARLTTNHFRSQIWASLFFAATAAIVGYSFAVWGAAALGASSAVNAAGGIACVAGFILGIVAIWHRWLRHST
jgi:manganese/zinc/iron transport system permease protein